MVREHFLQKKKKISDWLWSAQAFWTPPDRQDSRSHLWCRMWPQRTQPWWGKGGGDWCLIFVVIPSNIFLITFYSVLFLFYFLFVALLIFFSMWWNFQGLGSQARPELLWWEHWVQVSGLTENFCPQGILIGASLPEVLILALRSGSTQLPGDSSGRCLRSNNHQDKYSTTHLKKMKW